MNDDTTRINAVTPNPTHQITLKIEEEYILACASVFRTRGVAASLVTEIAQATIEHQKENVLVDVRELEERLGVFDSYYLVTKDFQRLRGKGIL
jgi:rhodanese-related sulfurtransferase